MNEKNWTEEERQVVWNALHEAYLRECRSDPIWNELADKILGEDTRK